MVHFPWTPGAIFYRVTMTMAPQLLPPLRVVGGWEQRAKKTDGDDELQHAVPYRMKMGVEDSVTRTTKLANAVATAPPPPPAATHWSSTVSSTLTMVYWSSGGRSYFTTLPCSKRLAAEKMARRSRKEKGGAN